MGFTIEDMLVVSSAPYKMELVAGKNGWSNSIKWILLVEGKTILEHFTGKELAVTTGLGYSTEEKLLELVETLSNKHSSGLIINTGYYVHDIPKSVYEKCNENDLPLLTVPWEISISDMIKDLTLSIYTQERADAQISKAMIKAIESPESKDIYVNNLLSYFDIDGKFQTVLITTGNLDTMDTVDRNRLSYRLQLYLENLTHNGNFFYYDSNYVLIMNDVSERETLEIIEGFYRRVLMKMPESSVYVGVGSVVKDITNLHISYHRAKSAIAMALKNKNTGKAKESHLVYFDQMGIDRLFYSIDDKSLLREMSDDILAPLVRYDEKHATNYVETLKLFLEYNGSIQSVSEKSFTHRNTVIYRINNIKKLLNSELSTPEERLPYLIACMIYDMND